MRIAINTRFLLPHKMEGFGWYTYEVVKRMVEYHPEHEFIFFFDRPYDKKFIFGKNVTPVVLNPPARHPILFIGWFEVAVHKALKKYNADLFFSPDGYLSLRSNVPQINVIHDINFEHNPKDLKPIMRWYYRRYFPKFARKAKKIITVSNYSKKDISVTYQIPEEKIVAIWNGVADDYKPIAEDLKVKIRNKYSEGQPYFLFVGALHPRKNVRRLIDAFSKLKEEEHPYDLVIVGTELWGSALADVQIPESIKQHIHFTGHLSKEELAKVMGAASIFTFVPYFEGFGIPLVEAMKCGVPIIAGDRTSLPEVAGDAALYCNPFDIEDIYNKMKSLSNNEELQQDLTKKGLDRAQLFSWDKTSERVWNVIEQEIKNHE